MAVESRSTSEFIDLLKKDCSDEEIEQATGADLLDLLAWRAELAVAPLRARSRRPGSEAEQ